MSEKVRKGFLLFFFLLVTGCVSTAQKANDQEERSRQLDKALNGLTSQIVKSIRGTGRKKIAIIEFSDLDGNVTQFGQFLAEELITRLFTSKKFEVIERQLLNKVLEEHKLSLSGLVDPSSARELGRLLGVDAIVSGTITDLGTSLKINARLISTETGEVFAVAATEIEKDEKVINLLSKISEKGSGKIRKETKEKRVEKPKKEYQQGLKAEYFNLPPFKDNPGAFPENPTYKRIDSSIDFDWGHGSPAPNITVDYFGVRWTGEIQIPDISGTYLFSIRHDDGVRLILDGQVLIENWHPYSLRWAPSEKEIFLEQSGWHSIRVELFEWNQGAGIELYWQPPGSDKLEIVPSTRFRMEE